MFSHPLTDPRPAALARRTARCCNMRRSAGRLAVLVASGPFAMQLACAQLAVRGVELAATTIGSGDIAAPSQPVYEAFDKAGDELVVVVPKPLVSLTATRAEPNYRFRGTQYDEVRGVSYRWWLGNGRGAVGFGLGTIGYAVPVATEGAALPATTVIGSVPTTSIGLRYALTPTTLAYADGSRARGLGGEPHVFYNAKAGVEWKPAKSRVGFEGGRLGLQLDSGYRMSLRTKKGGIGVYLRGTF